jgi:hypothetical protein
MDFASRKPRGCRSLEGVPAVFLDRDEEQPECADDEEPTHEAAERTSGRKSNQERALAGEGKVEQNIISTFLSECEIFARCRHLRPLCS